MTARYSPHLGVGLVEQVLGDRFLVSFETGQYEVLEFVEAELAPAERRKVRA